MDPVEVIMTFLDSLSGMEMVFAVCAGVGGILFVLRTVLALIGHDSDAGLEMDADLDVGVDGDADFGHGDADSSFAFFSVQSLTAFFMMFGLVGLMCTRQFSLNVPTAILASVGGGLLSMWIIGKTMVAMMKLQSDGTMDVNNAIGEEGEVYLRIPSDDKGKVQIGIQGALRILSAVSESKEEIKTGERVRVVRVVNGNVLSVDRV